MGKRKPEDELSRFVWKRNPQYDITLLGPVEGYNPFAYKNQKPWWIEVADSVKELDPRMRGVTDRNCRERTMELLRLHRKNELSSIRASGTSDEQLTKLQLALTNIAKMEEAKPSKELRTLYSKNGKEEAEEERTRAVEAVSDSSEDEQECDQENPDDFDYEKDKQKKDKQKESRFGKSDPKQQLVKYLETKSDKEIVLRKEELRLREKEVENKAKEIENKSKELDLMRLKAEGEAEERKKFMELLTKLVTPKQP